MKLISNWINKTYKITKANQNNIGVINTSITAEITKRAKDIINSSDTSNTILSNFFEPKTCLITATDIIPPAKAATK